MSVPQPDGVSYWVASAPPTAYPALTGRVDVDVAIVGAGLVGITTAWLLKRAGLTVAVLEARRAAAQVTGRTTAKITALHGLALGEIAAKHGEAAARLYAEANTTALAWIARTVSEEQIACDFESRDAWLFSEQPEGRARLQAEAGLCQRLGLPASFEPAAPLPFATTGALRLASQAQFHPVKYLQALLTAIPGHGSHVFENSRVTQVNEKDATLQANGGLVRARHVLIATGLPFLNRGGYFATTAPYGDPVVVAALHPSVAAQAPDGLFIGIDEAGHTVRTADGGRLLVVSGETYKTGQADTREQLALLERWLRSHFRLERIEYRWTNEDFDSADLLPFVGHLTAATPAVWIATGLSGWGMTNGTVAALILADRVRGLSNRWADLFDSRRWHPMAAAPRFFKENLNAAGEWVRDHLLPGELGGAARLGADEAAILQSGAGKIAAYRDHAGALHVVSASCPHMHCIVSWNGVDRTWDCPCHGSRFGIDGAVINGPALTGLNRIKRDRA